MAMDLAEVDSVGCRGFGPTAARVLNTGAKYDCIGRGLGVAMNQMDPELCVCVVTNEELGKAPDMCVGHSRLLGIVEEFVVAIESLVVRSLEKQSSSA